jgi:acyl-CoA synthetase (AMP-forming)/AMP-acid ligase II/acyl carrier protein
MHTPFENLLHTLRSRAVQKPHDVVFTYLLDGSDGEVSVTYAELDRQARSIAARLQADGMAGRRVLLLYVPGLEFIAALYGCLYAGAIPVPAYPPDGTRLGRTLPRLRAIVQDCDAALVLTTPAILSMAEALFADAPDLAEKRWATSVTMSGGDGAGWREPEVNVDDIAFLQYTSGSTAVPKGVVVTHRAVLANLRMISQAYRLDENTCVAAWIPFYHDMGLIGTILLTPFLGGSSVLMAPMEFIKRPLRWLRAFHEHKATMSWAPNFALDYCVRKIPHEERKGLDLSSWSTLIVGAEPVRHDTLQRFARTFEPYGFRTESFVPSYGLAEVVLLASAGPVEGNYRVAWFCHEALEQGRVLPCDRNAKTARSLVGCGAPVVGERIEIVDPDTGTRCPPDRLGEIWIAGPNVAQGYWRRPEELGLTFQASLSDTGEGQFLRTGDLGFLHQGQLYIGGRLKDLIILRGRNIYPQDVELTVEQCHHRIRPSCTAAFTIEATESEELVVVAEVATQDLDRDGHRKQQALDAVIAAVVEAVGQEHEIPLFAVALIEARSIPKTSSGKIQRKITRAAFLNGDLLIERRWERSEPLPANDHLVPRTPTEEVLRDIWKEVLDLEHIGVHDNFFALGGQSVLATQVVARLHSVFGLELPAQTVFEAKTISDLARIIDGLNDPSRMEVIEL